MAGPQKEEDFFGNVDPAQEESMESCFKTFDKDRDDRLSVDEFGALCRALFRNQDGQPYPLETKKLAQMFFVFDKNEDGFIDREEFKLCWKEWLTVILRPVTALVVVDVQNDFISGSLAVCNCPAGDKGEEVVPIVNKLLDSVKFDVVAYSLDWHPAHHLSFVTNVANFPIHLSSKVSASEAKTYDTVIYDQPEREQVLWPPHCQQDTWGAELHPDLKVLPDAVWVKKGTNGEIDSYSAFFDNGRVAETNLRGELMSRHVTDVYVCGIATDVCVAATATHSLEEGFRTVVVEDACRGVNADNINATKRRLTDQHGVIIDSAQVGAMVAGRDRPPEMALKLALDLTAPK